MARKYSSAKFQYILDSCLSTIFEKQWQNQILIQHNFRSYMYASIILLFSNLADTYFKCYFRYMAFRSRQGLGVLLKILGIEPGTPSSRDSWMDAWKILFSLKWVQNWYSPDNGRGPPRHVVGDAEQLNTGSLKRLHFWSSSYTATCRNKWIEAKKSKKIGTVLTWKWII